MKSFEIGDLVRVNFGKYNGAIGCVYDTYQDFDDSSKYGVSIIMKDGDDVGGFSYREQQVYIELYTKTDFSYKFVSVMRLADDFRKGMFTYPFSFIR